MALHNLRITVVDGGKVTDENTGTTGDSGQKQPGGKNSALYKIFHLNQTIKNKVKQATTPTQFFALQSAVNLATQTAKQFVNYYISDIGRKNGDANYQAVVNRRIEQVTDVLSIGQGALGGAGAGAVFGVPGVVIGAVVGAASSGVNLGFKYAERERDYQYQRFTDNNNQAYNLARANYSVFTGRVR